MTNPPPPPDSNLSGLYSLVTQKTSGVVTAIGSLAGALADVGGVIGIVDLVLNLINPPPDIAQLLDNGFASMSQQLSQIAQQIGELELETKWTATDQVMAGALGVQESLPDIVAANDPAQWANAISLCTTAVAYFTQPDVWRVPSGALIPYYDHWSGEIQQTPDSNGFILSTLYILPQYLRALTILIGVVTVAPGGALAHQALLRSQLEWLTSIYDQITAQLGTVRLPSKSSDYSTGSDPRWRPPWKTAVPSAPFGAFDLSSTANNVIGYTLPPATGFVPPLPPYMDDYFKVLSLRALARYRALSVEIGLPTVRLVLNILAALTSTSTPVRPVLEEWTAAEVFGKFGIPISEAQRYQYLFHIMDYQPPFNRAQPGSFPLVQNDLLGEIITDIDQLHIVAQAGGLSYHTVLTSKAVPQPQGVSQITSLGSTGGEFIAATVADGALHVFQQVPGMVHTVRYPDGSWQSTPLDINRTHEPGSNPLPYTRVAAAGHSGSTSIELAGARGVVLITSRPVYAPGDLAYSVLSSEWQSTGAPVGIDVAAAEDGITTHYVAVDAGGLVWHTTAVSGQAVQGSWESVSGVSAPPGPFTMVRCATVSTTLHLVGVHAGQLWHTLRNSNGSWQAAWGQILPAGGPAEAGEFSSAACGGDSAILWVVGAASDGLWLSRRFIDTSWGSFIEVGSTPTQITDVDCAIIHRAF